jgi:Fur family transcriptional regulator, ferric uptake regulator
VAAARTPTKTQTQGAERLSAAVGELRAQGTRITDARVAILGVLSATDAHLSADDIAHAVNELQPRVHRATVYRTLESLVTAGLVAHTHLGHGNAVYHLTTVPHAHCQCQRCETIIDVPRTLLRGVSSRLLEDYGFNLDTGHSALLGLCKRCAEVGAGETRAGETR